MARLTICSPLTPIGVQEGWVEGAERTITSVSGNYPWKHQAPPKIYLFDLDGKRIEHQIESVKTADSWRVPINLKDWAQIAVIE